MSIGAHSIGLRKHRKRRRNYETLQRLYVTISADGVTCSTSDAADAPADVPPVLTLPILEEIDRNVTVGTSGSLCVPANKAKSVIILSGNFSSQW